MQFRYSGAIQIFLEVHPFDLVLITLSTLLAVVAVQVIHTKGREWWKKAKDYKTTYRVGTLRSGSSSPSPTPARWSAAVSRRSPSHSDGSFTSNGRSAQTSRPKAKAKARASRRPIGQTPTQQRHPQEPVPEPEIQPLVRDREEVPSTPRGPLGGLELGAVDDTGTPLGENRGYSDPDLIQHLEDLSDQLHLSLVQGPEYGQQIYEHTE